MTAGYRYSPCNATSARRECSAVIGKVLFIVLFLGHPLQVLAECRVEKFADLPVVMNGRQPIVEGTINGIPATFVADSGAFFSMLWADRVNRFKLQFRNKAELFQLVGANGPVSAHRTTVDDFALTGFGSGVLHKVQFLVVGSSISSEDGVIGQNILGRADTEFDLAKGAIRLFHSSGCEGYSLAYWHGTTPVSEIRIRPTSDLQSHIVGTAMLNGSEITVLFDTGASRSALNLKAARRAGFDPAKAERSFSAQTSPLGGPASEIWFARFADLDLGGEKIRNVLLEVSEFTDDTQFDLLLGVDFFLSHRIFVAGSQHKIYFTYNGGRIFDLPDPVAGNPGAEPAAAPRTEAAGESPLDAAQYMRRGAASAARGELQHAIADFDAAIRLKPDDAESYYRRGAAKMQIHQYPGAREDIDQALKLQPQNATWLNSRGVLRVLMKDDQGAAADFDAAAHFAPEFENLDLDVAEYLTQFGQLEAAIVRIDHWVNSHPKSTELPNALNSRCWYRAMLGKELEKALADCNASLALKPHMAEALDSRGLVYLRLGDYDKSIADYKAALRRSPKEADSLYGLGLAQLKKGQQSDASKNMAQALAIDSGTAERFRKFGVSP